MSISKHYLHDKKHPLGGQILQTKSKTQNQASNQRPRKHRKQRHHRVTVGQGDISDIRTSAVRLSFNHGQNTAEVDPIEDMKSTQKKSEFGASQGQGEEVLF